MSNTTRLKSTLFVGGLDNNVTAGILHAAFVPFGEIVDISLPKPEQPSSTDPHRGFGYIEFELAEDAREALDNMDQSELFGRIIKVATAKPQKDTSEGLGSKTAVWAQVRQWKTSCINFILKTFRRIILLSTLSMTKTSFLLPESTSHTIQCKDLKD
jgi:RNA recognition motif-containing protein